VAAIPFFLLSLKHFKKELRRAYRVLCYGIGFMGLAQIQLPVTTYFNWIFWQDSGAIAIPYLVGILCIFWGVRMFARIFNIRGFWTSFLWAGFLTVILSLISLFPPHVHQPGVDEATYHLSVALTILDSVYATFAAVMIFKIRRKIGPIYQLSMTWLCVAQTTFTFGGWHYLVNQLAVPPGNWYYDFSISLVPFALSGLFFVLSGVAFDNAGSILVHAPETEQQTSPRLVLDVVLYLAGLASNPSDIDPFLDNVREVTSGLQPGQVLSPQDVKHLANTYNKLEGYLTQHDPLRVFTAAELHNKITQQFAVDTTTKALLWEEGHASRSAHGRTSKG